MIVLLLCLTCLVAGFAFGGTLAVRFALPKDAAAPAPIKPTAPLIRWFVVAILCGIVALEWVLLLVVYRGSRAPDRLDDITAFVLLAIALWLFAWYLCKSLLRAMNGGGTSLPVLPFIGLVLLSAVLFVSTFAFAFHIFGLTPNEVSASGGDMLYFSTVTFSTLGYGDMSPATPITKTLAAIEAVIGNLHLAALVGAVFAAVKPA